MKHSINLLAVCAALLLFVSSCDQNENENEPQISDQEFQVNEHSEAGTVVGTIVAYDLDEGQKLSFSILEGNEDQGFALDEATGEMVVNQPDVLDFETHPEFQLKVSVCDNHSEEPRETIAVVSIHLQNIYEWVKDLHGLVQKGPYINGAQLTAFELTSEMEQTGRAFQTEIMDNYGSWELSSLELNSPYIKIQANGFYFNECFGEISSAQLSLNSLVDVDQVENSNINILSHLEYERQLSLIEEGLSFSDAKAQAHQEILGIFGFDKMEVDGSDQLNLSESGEGNSVLLAISLILQGYTSVGEMSELVALISDDIRDDGILDSPGLGSRLINNARHIKLDEIRQHIEERYTSLGQDVTIPDFETPVQYFIENTSYTFTGGIEYPESGAFGFNILDTTNHAEFEQGYHSMTAIIPVEMSIRVTVQCEEALLDYDYNMANTGWAMQNWEFDFVNTRIGEVDSRIWFGWFEWDPGPFPEDSINNPPPTGPYEVDIQVYENGDTEPTWTNTVTVKDGSIPSELLDPPPEYE